MKQFIGKSPPGLFAARTLGGHLIRGSVGVALLYVAISQQHPHPGWSILAGLLAPVAMRGCPACWTVGLVEALHQRTRAAETVAPPTSAGPPTEGFTVPFYICKGFGDRVLDLVSIRAAA